MTLDDAVMLQECLERGDFVFITPKGDVYSWYKIEQILAVVSHLSNGGDFPRSFAIGVGP